MTETSEIWTGKASSGTGLSTSIWGERAERVIGIEPNADMRKEATHNVEDHPYAAHRALSA